MAPKPTCVCGECQKCIRREKLRDYRARNPQKHLAANRAWARRNRPALVEAKRKYRNENREKDFALSRAWADRNPEKRSAHSKVAYALRKGEMTRQPCEVCNNPRAQAHHDDYGRPLDVRWLCPKHHAEHHRRRDVLDSFWGMRVLSKTVDLWRELLTDAA